MKINLRNIAEGYLNLIKKGFRVTNKDVEDLSRWRTNICKECENKENVICKLCGCILAAKTRVLEEKCPIDKW